MKGDKCVETLPEYEGPKVPVVKSHTTNVCVLCVCVFVFNDFFPNPSAACATRGDGEKKAFPTNMHHHHHPR